MPSLDMSLVFVLLSLAVTAMIAVVIIALAIRLAAWRPNKDRDTSQGSE